MRKQILILFNLWIFSGCSTSADKPENELIREGAEKDQVVSVSRDILDGMMQTLPSPIEMANLITKSKSGFNESLLIPSDNAGAFTDKYEQALALGGYGVNMGYLNLNNKLLYVVDYLKCINTVSKELKVNHLLDFSMMSELAQNRNNVDSLIRISTENFNEIDEYLRGQNRGDLSVLILIGSWLEGLHMFNEIAKENPSEEITNRIGEQKIIIDNIYAILGKLTNIPYYDGLREKLKGLKNVYSGVWISYIYKEPEMTEVNGELVVVDKSEMEITITADDIHAISLEIERLRNDLFRISV